MEQSEERIEGTEEEIELNLKKIPPFRLLFLASLLVYLGLFIGGYYLGYNASFNDAQNYIVQYEECIRNQSEVLVWDLKNNLSFPTP